MIVGINGFGRIGKQVYRILVKNGITVALVNEPFINLKVFYHLARYDSVYGTLEEIQLKKKSIVAYGLETFLSNEKDPSEIKWARHGVEYVVECSGIFKTHAECDKHDAPKVILTCPSIDIPMFVFGVNHWDIKDTEKIISAASCTTNCLAPLVQLMNDNYGVEEGFVTTIHSMTGSQHCVDSTTMDLRSGRGCFNIIPATTGSAMAIEKVIPAIAGKISAMSYRIPLPSVSMIEFIVKTERPATLEKIQKIISNQKNPLIKSVLGIVEEDLVSSDFIGDTRSSIVDFRSCSQLSPNFLKLVSWYDNEYGYSCRVCDLILYLESKKKTAVKVK
jgi:glyceraldehyde 3-phosphate dehydrogenase